MSSGKMLRGVVKYAGVCIVIAAVALPFYWILVSSLKPTSELIRAVPTFFPERFTRQHYEGLFAASAYPQWLLNSAAVAVATMVLTVTLAALGAYSVYRLRYPGRETVMRVLLVTYVFPGALLIIPIYELMTRLGLVNNLVGLVVIHVTFAAPFSVWLLRGFFQGIPRELEDAAAIDGCSRLRVLLKIFVPLAAPGIATVAIFAFLNSWTEYVFANILIIDDPLKTLPVGLAHFINQYIINWGLLTAGAVVTALPPLVLFALVGRHFVKGLTEGAFR